MAGQETHKLEEEDRMEQKNQNIFTSDIEAGVQLLNNKKPGWYNEIDIDNLKMSNCSRCILGQLFENYFKGLDILGINIYIDDAILYGFNINMVFQNEKYWNILTQEWIDKILQLRSQT